MPMHMPLKTPVPPSLQAPGVPLPIYGGDLAVGQLHTTWCWAACVQLVLAYRNHDESQCALANDVMRLTKDGNCCASSLPVSCDDGLFDAEVSDLFHTRGVTSQIVNGSLTAQELKEQLDHLKPVAVGLDWGHMLVVHGRTTVNRKDRFFVYDPLGPADGTATYSQIVDYGVGTNNWEVSWKEL
jgi:hypothetical protein